MAHPNVVDDNETDMVDAMLDRTGCKQIHYDLRVSIYCCYCFCDFFCVKIIFDFDSIQ